MAIKGTINNVAVCGMACAVPADRIDNSNYVRQFGDDQMQKFERMVGVKARRYVNNSPIFCK